MEGTLGGLPAAAGGGGLGLGQEGAEQQDVPGVFTEPGSVAPVLLSRGRPDKTKMLWSEHISDEAIKYVYCLR